MLKSHVKFHSVEGKRLILIADDEPANRALLGLVTEDEYDILYAEDGEETLRLMRENASFLSLVLLDLNMPKKTGFLSTHSMGLLQTKKGMLNIPFFTNCSCLIALQST